MTNPLTRHLPLTLDGCHIEASAGKVYLCHVEGYDLGPAEQEAIAAEIVRRVNLFDEVAEALRTMDACHAAMMRQANQNAAFYDFETLALMHNAPLAAAAILAKVGPEGC
jgi:hypothetical protein